MHEDSATTRTQDELVLRPGAGAGAVASARQVFDRWLRERTDDAELLEDMAVVISELSSNAVDGADPDRPEAEIRARIDGDVLRIVVSNRLSADADEIRHWDLDDPLRGGGRGLMIVRAYTDSLTIDSTGGTVSVHCARVLDPTS